MSINLFARLFGSTKTVWEQLFKLGELIPSDFIDIMFLEFDIFGSSMIIDLGMKPIINSPFTIPG